MKTFNKNLFIVIIGLLTYLNTYTTTIESLIAVVENLTTSACVSTSSSSSISTFDITPYNLTTETATEKLTFQTVTYEDKITLVGDYSNNETGETAHIEAPLYPDNSFNQNSLQFDLPSLSNTIDIPDISNPSNTQQDHNLLNDLLNDSALDAHRQRINENQTTQTQSTTIKKQIKVIREQDLQKNKVYFPSDFGDIPLDSDLILQKQNVFHDPRSTLSSPIITARLDRLITFYTYKANLNSNFQSELTFCKAFRSGQVLHLLDQIYDSNLPTAKTAFNELKKLWIRERKHMFLAHNSYNNRELDFITQLGIDVMIKAERALITRPDYIIEHTNKQSLKTIQEYKKYCIQLQQEGNRSGLLDEIKKLQPNVTKRSDLATKISFAIAQKIFFDPATTALHEIAHVTSLENACIQVKNLELHLLIQAHQRNIVNENQMRTCIIEHYGFDLLDAAQNCYKSRPDYVYTPDNQSYLSDTMKPILRNLESKNLQGAHAELVHLEKQLTEGFKDLNITNPMAQEKYMTKYFGTNVLEAAHKKYEARLDHKKLVDSFMAIDVNQAAITILENNNTYESVANEMNDLAKHIFGNARLCNLSNLPKIESHVYDSIDAMRTAQDHPTFIFNLSMVNHTLGDIQQLAHAILSGRHPVLERSSELLIRGFDKFFKGLDPFTQVSNMGHLTCDLGSVLKKSSTALWNDPITTIHNGITTTFTLTELIRNTADFTSDLTVGKLYLSPEEYKQRTDAFCEMMQPLQGVTAEHCVDFVAQVTADVVFFKGLGNTYTFLKEIDALGKFSESAASVARIFKKGFNTHLANNPIVVTAEGVTIKMSDAMHNINNSGSGKNIINNSKALLESAYVKIAVEVNKEATAIKKIYDRTKDGFAEFADIKVTMECKHILGMELDLSKKGKLTIGGFHHDLKNVIEKSDILSFTNRVTYEHGFYKVALFDKGNFVKDTTFFPAEWPRDTVINKIYEAYDNFIKNGATSYIEKGNKYVIRGKIKEGIEIEMYITKNGNIVTAYPILERL